MAHCPSCGVELLPGTRWCHGCHAYVGHPEVGRLASPARRLGASLLDGVLGGLVVAGILVVSGILGFAVGSERGGAVFWLVLWVLMAAFVVWELILLARGQTLGKKVLRMRVVREDGGTPGFWTMLVRETLGKWLSGLIFGLGYLWILIDREHQGWHDKLLRTYVVQR